MGVSVRWNGTKDRVTIVSGEPGEPSKKEAEFFAALRVLDSELDGKNRSPNEDRFLSAMREWLDEVDRGLAD